MSDKFCVQCRHYQPCDVTGPRCGRTVRDLVTGEFVNLTDDSAYTQRRRMDSEACGPEASYFEPRVEASPAVSVMVAHELEAAKGRAD